MLIPPEIDDLPDLGTSSFRRGITKVLRRERKKEREKEKEIKQNQSTRANAILHPKRHFLPITIYKTPRNDLKTPSRKSNMTTSRC